MNSIRRNSQNDAARESAEAERRRTVWLAMAAGVLFLAAVVIVLRMVATWRQEAALHLGELYTRPAIVSRLAAPRPSGPMAPYEDLGLTADQRKRIQKIMDASLSSTTPAEAAQGPDPSAPEGSGIMVLAKQPGPGQSDQPVYHKFDIDKIRAVLTPEQREKLDASKNNLPPVQGPGG